MIITRKDFKELVEIYKRAWDAFVELEKYYNSDVIGAILFKGVDWIQEKTKTKLIEEDDDILCDLVCCNSGGTAINYREDENGNWYCDFTKDLDKIYEYYFMKDGEEPQMTMFTSLKEFDEYEEILDEIHRDINEMDNYYNTDAFIDDVYEAVGWLGKKIEEVGFEDFI